MKLICFSAQIAVIPIEQVTDAALERLVAVNALAHSMRRSGFRQSMPTWEQHEYLRFGADSLIQGWASELAQPVRVYPADTGIEIGVIPFSILDIMGHLMTAHNGRFLTALGYYGITGRTIEFVIRTGIK